MDLQKILNGNDSFHPRMSMIFLSKVGTCFSYPRIWAHHANYFDQKNVAEVMLEQF